jgi:hypothetical protein
MEYKGKPAVWLTETRGEDAQGRRVGSWYPCGYEVHRRKRDADAEGRKLTGPGPHKSTRYVRAV